MEPTSRKRDDWLGPMEGANEECSSCSGSSESSGGSTVSSPEESEEEESASQPGTAFSSSLTLIRTNATCEMCGIVGVRDAFYSKTKRFCSVSCSRSFSSNSKKASILARLQGKPPSKKTKVPSTKGSSSAQHQNHQQGGAKKSNVFDWGRYLGKGDFAGAPVSCFRHVPMRKLWKDIGEGVRVEVLNTDSGLSMKVYWIAAVVKLAGFQALLRYEGFDGDSSRDFWLNLCVSDVHPVGWCAAGGQPLVPPQSILHRFNNWKSFLVKRLTGSKTLPADFSSKVRVLRVQYRGAGRALSGTPLHLHLHQHSHQHKLSHSFL